MSNSKRSRIVENENQSLSDPSFKAGFCSRALHVSPIQLRELWCYDNECGNKFMIGCPLRKCSSLQEQELPEINGLSPKEMTLVKFEIRRMWMKAGRFFEAFTVKNEENEGIRLRVISDLASKISIKRQDQIPIGWIAKIPAAVLSAHVYKRSPIHPDCYLGGPVSLMNWCPGKDKTVIIRKGFGKNSAYICFMCTATPLAAGMELKWDYGSKVEMPHFGVWFKNKCCSIVNHTGAEVRRREMHQNRRSFVFRELCVLCGFPYSIENQENRIQRKQHLANKHADFLGSAWDGTGLYEGQAIDVNALFVKVDELNYLLNSLKALRWNVLPACKIFTAEEREQFGANMEALMDEFERRKNLYKKGGTIVLRGTEMPSSVLELEPIRPSCWKTLTWHNNKKPEHGRYAIPLPPQDHDLALNRMLEKFCEKYLTDSQDSESTLSAMTASNATCQELIDARSVVCRPLPNVIVCNVPSGVTNFDLGLLFDNICRLKGWVKSEEEGVVIEVNVTTFDKQNAFQIQFADVDIAAKVCGIQPLVLDDGQEMFLSQEFEVKLSSN